jgi:hypothetical protein
MGQPTRSPAEFRLGEASLAVCSAMIRASSARAMESSIEVSPPTRLPLGITAPRALRSAAACAYADTVSTYGASVIGQLVDRVGQRLVDVRASRRNALSRGTTSR